MLPKPLTATKGQSLSDIVGRGRPSPLPIEPTRPGAEIFLQLRRVNWRQSGLVSSNRDIGRFLLLLLIAPLQILNEVTQVFHQRLVLLLISCTLAVGVISCGGSSGMPPTITTQPQNQTVAQGSSATFTVMATGTSPLSYQWMENGVTISGATSASYTTPPTTPADNNAQFSVVVSNETGSVTSNSATLRVLLVP